MVKPWHASGVRPVRRPWTEKRRNFESLLSSRQLKASEACLFGMASEASFDQGQGPSIIWEPIYPLPGLVSGGYLVTRHIVVSVVGVTWGLDHPRVRSKLSAIVTSRNSHNQHRILQNMRGCSLDSFNTCPLPSGTAKRQRPVLSCLQSKRIMIPLIAVRDDSDHPRLVVYYWSWQPVYVWCEPLVKPWGNAAMPLDDRQCHLAPQSP